MKGLCFGLLFILILIYEVSPEEISKNAEEKALSEPKDTEKSLQNDQVQRLAVNREPVEDGTRIKRSGEEEEDEEEPKKKKIKKKKKNTKKGKKAYKKGKKAFKKERMAIQKRTSTSTIKPKRAMLRSIFRKQSTKEIATLLNLVNQLIDSEPYVTSFPLRVFKGALMGSLHKNLVQDTLKEVMSVAGDWRPYIANVAKQGYTALRLPVPKIVEAFATPTEPPEPPQSPQQGLRMTP